MISVTLLSLSKHHRADGEKSTPCLCYKGVVLVMTLHITRAKAFVIRYFRYENRLVRKMIRSTVTPRYEHRHRHHREKRHREISYG